MLRTLFAALAFTPLVSLTALADEAYPIHSIRLVVPFPAGGGVDTIARILQPKLEASLGQAVVVDNRPGAASIIGTEVVAKAAPDGYTLLFALNPHVVNVSLYKSLPYDPIADFTPISLVATVPNELVVNPALPAYSVADLIRLAKQQPGQLNFGSAGVGSPFHLAGELFKVMAGVNITHIPYKGGPQATVDLLSNRVQLMFGNSFNVQPYVKDGRLRALAVTSTSRSTSLPQLPTVAETVPGYEFVSWFGILAPAGTPVQAIQRVHDAIVTCLHDPKVREQLKRQDADPIGDSPDEFRQFLKSELTKWKRVINDAGIKPQ